MTLEQQAAALTQDEIVALLVRRNELEQELSWFRRQLFGQKSERRAVISDPRQLTLGESVALEEQCPPPTETIREYQRRTGKQKLEGQVDESGLRFDDSVPVETILVPDPRVETLSEGVDYEIISEKVTHRLAQRPGAYVILRYVRQVAKLNESGELSCAPAPSSVLERSYADVSFLAGLLIDKFVYHLPLYRQHQRLRDAGIELSRQTLTNLVHRSASLLEPIYYAQLSSILQSEVLAMDETPIKAGRTGKGKMRQGYFWPLYGDKDEVAFPYAASRALKVVREILGEYCGTLLTDGYEAYERFATAEERVVHAQCWTHARRYFVEAERTEPVAVETALKLIARLYQQEALLSELGLEDAEKIAYRQEQCRPIVMEFFEFLEKSLAASILLPSNPLTKAASYALSRQAALSVFLEHPGVPLDTNHLERALRPIPLGRKNWMFCSTECGAEAVGKVQSLLVTCRLHGIDPHAYLVDVLQRIDTHPAFEVHLLTPRLWKENFSKQPIGSDLDCLGCKNAAN